MFFKKRWYTEKSVPSRYNGPPDTISVFNTERFIVDAILAVATLIILLSIWPFSTVPTGYRGVVTQFGAIQGIHQEGLVILPPWQKMALFNIRSETAQIDNAQGSTNDTQPVDVDLTVRYSIQPDRVADVYEKYSHDGDLSSQVSTATQEVFKAVTAKYSAPDLIAQRAKVSSDINAALAAKLALYGARVIAVDMRNFSFQKSYMDAINQKAAQEQLRYAAENKVKTVEAEQRQVVVTAQAKADAKRAEADGEAYSITKLATANADALKIQSAALATSSGGILELKRIGVEQTRAERWDGKLPENMYSGAPIPFLNLTK